MRMRPAMLEAILGEGHALLDVVNDTCLVLVGRGSRGWSVSDGRSSDSWGSRNPSGQTVEVAGARRTLARRAECWGG